MRRFLLVSQAISGAVSGTLSTPHLLRRGICLRAGKRARKTRAYVMETIPKRARQITAAGGKKCGRKTTKITK